ncbi:MAG: hypothetical protein ABL964_10360 [Steroidobacteraceae bacterium]
MTLVQPWLADHFWWMAGLLVLALAATAYVFSKRRGFDSGFLKGVAANPEKVRRQNPPD